MMKAVNNESGEAAAKISMKILMAKIVFSAPVSVCSCHACVSMPNMHIHMALLCLHALLLPVTYNNPVTILFSSMPCMPLSQQPSLCHAVYISVNISMHSAVSSPGMGEEGDDHGGRKGEGSDDRWDRHGVVVGWCVPCPYAPTSTCMRCGSYLPQCVPCHHLPFG